MNDKNNTKEAMLDELAERLSDFVYAPLQEIAQEFALHPWAGDILAAIALARDEEDEYDVDTVLALMPQYWDGELYGSLRDPWGVNNG